MVTIVIDAGHGGFDNGAMYQGRKEKDENLSLALAVGEILKQQGYDVIYTRNTDVYQSPYEKAQIANDAGADYFVSFHRNSGANDNTYHGVQTLIYGGDDMRARRLAESIYNELEQVGFDNIGIEERTGLVVLRRTEMPAVLIETGFINNDMDNEIFDSNFNEIASAIAMGIERAVPLRASAVEQERKEPVRTIAGRGRCRCMADRDGRNDWDNDRDDEDDWDDDRDDEDDWDDDRDDKDSNLVYGVEVGRFGYRTTANFLAEQLADQGFESYVAKGDGMLRVVAGKEDSLEDALKLQRKLRELGYQTLIVASER